MFSQGFSNSTMEIKVALVFWKVKHHCPNTFYYKISQNSTMVENIYGPWENTAYPMFMHWSVSLGWLWNCNVVNQKASFLCTTCIYIYIYLYIVTIWYLAKCMTRRHFFLLKIFIFILHVNRFYLWCMFKKNHDTPCLINQKSSEPLYQFPICS